METKTITMIYECIIFWNELDLLEIRLNQLNDVVDKFVIVEAAHTFSSNPKSFYFEENKDRYSKFLDKIIHVKVEELPYFAPTKRRMGTVHNRHEVEHWHRNNIIKGLVDCSDDDIIIMGDTDEILKTESVIQAKEYLESNPNSIVSFKQRQFNYFLNGIGIKDGNFASWSGQTATTYGNFKKIGTDDPMDDKRCSCKVMYAFRDRPGQTFDIRNSGWHFSYLGGIDRIVKKIESFAHFELDTAEVKDKERIESVIREGGDLYGRHGYSTMVYIKIDESFPSYIVENQEKFKHLINSNITHEFE